MADRVSPSPKGLVFLLEALHFGDYVFLPDSFKTKEVSKLGVLEQILEPEKFPELYGDLYHKVRINYYPPRGDNKEGWDNIDIRGWLDYPRQKIKLAQGLIHGPEVIFLDEPTSGLDPKARQEMLETINGLTEVSGTNVLLSTHILQDVETVCDHVIIINNGKLQMQENVKKLMQRQTDVIQVRIGGSTKDFVKQLKKNGITATSGGRGLHVPYVDDKTFGQIIDSAVKSNCQLYEMERATITMDNIYLEVVD